ncbi:MAG TPA: D-aminoacylase [Gemmatimonadaceae bacterium]|nr:D-aminoacylase [Gemmatimonadaceae bacterium]
MTTRRDFVRDTTAGAAMLLGAPALLLRSRADADIIVRNGTIFDGTGGPGREADVVIVGGRIIAVTRKAPQRGALEIDARNLAVAPGFIDIHSHGDGSLWEDPRSESLIRQGITTIVVGQDGSSRVPSRRGASTASSDDPRHQFARFDELWAALAQLRPSVNVASMVGLGTVRDVVIGGDDRKATPDEMARMKSMVAEAIAEGACGASSGLEYTPGAFAPLEELIELCKPLAARRLPYATHMRNEDDRVLESIDEAIAVARGAGCPLQISHLKTQGPRNWGKLDAAFDRIARARGAGCDAAFDRYPYIAYQTGLTNLYPVWSRDGSTDAFLRRLVDPQTADRIKQEALAKVELIGGWDNVMIANVANADDRPAEGQRLGAYATSQGIEPYNMAMALLQHSHANVGMVGFAMSEDNLDRILAHPQGMVCSDGGAFAIDGPTRRGHPHPRGLGTFPRILGRYVRERKTLTLPQAINKMTALPASRIHLADRGRLAPRMAADVVVFDPATVSDTATYEDPFQYPVGIGTVIVNGVVAFHDGQRDDRHTGKPLRAM